MDLDQHILTWLTDHRTPALTGITRCAMVIGTGKAGTAVIALIFVLAVLAGRRWRAGFAIGGSVLLAQASARALKQLVARPRPPADLAIVQVGAFSMPSTVAAMTAAAALAVYSIVPWRTGFRLYAAVLLAAGTVSIGCAMVYLGAHWPTDVLAGWCVGAPVGVLTTRLVSGVARSVSARSR